VKLKQSKTTDIIGVSRFVPSKVQILFVTIFIINPNVLLAKSPSPRLNPSFGRPFLQETPLASPSPTTAAVGFLLLAPEIARAEICWIYPLV